MSDSSNHSLTSPIRYAILIVACLGWFFGGTQIGVNNLVRPAGLDLLGRSGQIDLIQHRALSTAGNLDAADQEKLNQWNALAAKWYGWLQCAFLFGAAAGGYLFGRLGDHTGRKNALAVALLFFGTLSGLTYFVTSPLQLLVLRFLTCMGVGGTWPNGVALVSEAWSTSKRPLVAGMIGMSGNIGILSMATLTRAADVSPDSWRWVMLVCAAPVLLAAAVWRFVPESPDWLTMKHNRGTVGAEGRGSPAAPSVFGKSYRFVTTIGIALATIPLFGGWGSANWMVPWADQVGEQIGNTGLAGTVVQARSITSIAGSFLAGWIASLVGRRRTYLLTSMGALAVAQYAFWMLTPGDNLFLIGVAVLGFFNGVYFGWLPFFLPELFPSQLRSTGAGVSFNFGRILTAATLFLSGAIIHLFDGDYAKLGRATSLIFALGIVVIYFTPDTSKNDLRRGEAE